MNVNKKSIDIENAVEKEEKVEERRKKGSSGNRKSDCKGRESSSKRRNRGLRNDITILSFPKGHSRD